MADPISAIGLGSTVLGGITGAAGSIMGGNAKADYYNYQAGIAQLNAQIAKQNASYETALGEQQAQMSGMKTRATISQTRANQGAGGLDVNTGSNAAVRESELSVGQYDSALIRNNASRRAYGFEVEAVGDKAQANLDRMAASTSETSGLFDAASSILGAGSSFSSKWMQAKSAGLPGY
jgi:hypothetical protein